MYNLVLPGGFMAHFFSLLVGQVSAGGITGSAEEYARRGLEMGFIGSSKHVACNSQLLVSITLYPEFVDWI